MLQTQAYLHRNGFDLEFELRGIGPALCHWVNRVCVLLQHSQNILQPADLAHPCLQTTQNTQQCQNANCEHLFVYVGPNVRLVRCFHGAPRRFWNS